MSTRHNRRGRRSTLTARVATAFAAVATLLAVAAPSASAFVPCPTHDIPAISDFWRFETKWPTAGANAKGVTLCQMHGTWEPKGWLQIVDLGDEAKVRLLPGEMSAYDPADHYGFRRRFNKRTARDWYTHLRSWSDNSATPTDRLFSVTNASFFKDSDNANPTMLPFPTKTKDPVGGTSGKWKMGVAGEDPSDPDHSAPKRYLGLGSPSPGDQSATIGPFPTYYRPNDILLNSTFLQYREALVSFEPTHPIGDRAMRNYAGVFEDEFYIFTSQAEYTNAEMTTIMEQIRPGIYTIQLDGGGSAQFHSQYGELQSNVPFPKRAVPDVLAIYRSRLTTR